MKVRFDELGQPIKRTIIGEADIYHSTKVMREQANLPKEPEPTRSNRLKIRKRQT